MNVQLFLSKFLNIVTGSTDFTELRKLIVRLSIKGKIVNSFKQDEKAASLGENTYKRVDKFEIELPLHWKIVSLGDVIQLISGQHLKPQEQNREGRGIPYVTGASDFGVLYPIITRWTEEAKSVADKGDILISVKGTIGKLNLVKEEPIALGRQVMAIRPLQLYPKYIYWVLFDRTSYFRGKSIGIAIPGISREDILSLEVGVPPIAEQKRIVAKLEELMALCGHLEEQQKQLAEIRQKAHQSLITNLTHSVTYEDFEASWRKLETNFRNLVCTISNIEMLKEAIKTLAVLGKLDKSGINSYYENIIAESLNKKKQLVRLKEIKTQNSLPPVEKDKLPHAYPLHWSVTMFDNLAIVSGGVTKGRKFNNNRRLSKHPFLRVANVQRGYFILDDIQEIEIPIDEYERYVLQEGDLLITEGGDWDKVGRTAIWRGQLQDCLHQNHVFKARMFSERIEKEWIELIFNSSVGKQYWASASKQTTNLASINMVQVRSFLVPLPSQEEQRRILYKVKKLLAICDELIDEINKSQEVQEKFSKAAIHYILHNQRNENIFLKDKSDKKRFKRQFNVEIALILSMENYLSNTTLAKILRINDGKMEAKELWKASALKNIDEFYALLKQEIEDGFIQEPDVAELKLVETDE